jgi:hypothetical protein
MVSFNDGRRREIDFEPVLRGELFAPLRDPAMFNAVHLDQEFGTLVWPNGADFDPATLHDWPECGSRLIELAAGWSDGETDERRILAVAEDHGEYAVEG